VSSSPLLCPPDKKQELEISNQAHVVDYFVQFLEHGRKRITEGVLLEIHKLTIEGIYPCAGNYRTALNFIEITDTDHKPSHPALVAMETRQMLEWLDGEGKDQSPVHRASYLLWRTNAIHPFNGGNGRVARSLAYLIILMEVARLFSGEPLPSKLKKRKAEYVAGLKAADRGSLAQLEELVLECLRAQISDIASGAH